MIMINECRQKGRIWCTPAVLVCMVSACLKYHNLSIFRPFFLHFIGNFEMKIFQVCKNGSKSIPPDKTGCHVKNQTSVIVYACCLNNTTKTMNKSTNEQPSSHFFFINPLYHQQHQQHHLCESARFSSRIMIFCFKHFLELSSRLLICCLLFTFHFLKFRRWIYLKATNFT